MHRVGADHWITRETCRRIFRCCFFIVASAPVQIALACKGVKPRAKSRPTGIVPAGVIMWSLMLHQCWSQAWIKTEGEEYQTVRDQQDKTLASSFTMIFSSTHACIHLSIEHAAFTYIYVECRSGASGRQTVEACAGQPPRDVRTTTV